MQPTAQYAPEPSFMERLGLDFLRRRNPNRERRVERWSAEQIEKIGATHRRAVWWAGVTGATSGGLLAGAEILLRMLLADDTEAASWREQLPFWASYMAIIVIVSAVEIAVLYWIVLRAVATLGAAAGLAFTRGQLQQVIARGLSRAALDFPNPHAPIYGIDPYARVPRYRLLLYALLYRLKVGATSFILRIGVRRVVARAAVRFLVPLLAVPVFAIWNALIVHWVMQSARIRAAGPVTVAELDAMLEERAGSLGELSRHLIVSGVEEVILRSQDAHPSYVLLLTTLFERLGIEPGALRTTWPAVVRQLPRLSGEEQEMLLTVLVAAVLVGGSLRRGESALLDEAHRACGRAFDRLGSLQAKRKFSDGQALGALDAEEPPPHWRVNS
jgi:hypothetical protein